MRIICRVPLCLVRSDPFHLYIRKELTIANTHRRRQLDTILLTARYALHYL